MYRPGSKQAVGVRHWNRWLHRVLGCLALICFASPAAAERLCSDAGSSATTGTLADSGGSSGRYGNNESCRFLIQASAGEAITLTFSSFSYESGDDYVTVYDGSSTTDTVLGLFTGSSLPSAQIASSGAMLVVHNSDSNVTRDGLVAAWSIQAGSGCTAESVADSFPNVSYAQNSGSQSWTTDWLEVGEADGPSSGIVRVNSSNCSSGNCLRLGEPSSRNTWSNRGVEREADLSGASSATLFFNYYSERDRGTESVALAVSADGGANWTTLQTYRINSTSFTPNPESFDISAFAGANTRVRFLSSGNNAIVGMYIDDLQISYQPSCQVSSVAEWRFDETSWNGTAGEVADSGSNGFDGTAFGGVNTVAAGQVCRGATFDGVDDRVQVAQLDDTLNATASLSFWLLTTQLGNNINYRAPGIAGVEANGSVDDVFWGWLDASGRIGVGGGDSGHAQSSTVVSDGDWHHVVLTRNHVSGEVTVFVDGTLEDSSISGAGVVPHSFTDLGRIRDTAGSHNYFSGVLDEVVMFDQVLTAADVVQIYDNQRAGESWDGEPRVCPNVAASGLIISHDGAGIHCVAEPVTVVAVDATQTIVPTYANEITLDTQSGRGSWSLASGSGTLNGATADDGLATYQFAGADNGQASFLLSYVEGATPLDVDAYQSNDTNVRDDDSEGALAFAPSGFTLTANALPNPPPLVIADPIATQVAGDLFDLHITAFGTTPTDPQCGVIESYQGNFSLKFWQDYLNPGSGTRTAMVDGSSIAASEAAAANQTVTFSAGQASVPVRYKDSGQIRLQVKDDSTYAHSLSGASNDFIVRPAALQITRVETLGGVANPAATTLSGPGFVASGQRFHVTVEAHDSQGDPTPNFGLESTVEAVRVSSDGLVAPVGGRHGSIDDVLGGNTFARTGPGQFQSSALAFDEVGIIALHAEVLDGDFLGVGSIPGPSSGEVGRFYPAAFVMSSNSVNAACNGFVYQDQPALQLSYTLQAHNTSGAVVENYDTGRYGSGNIAAVVRHAEDNDSGVPLNARLSVGSADWRDGVLVETDVSATFSRALAADGPFDQLQLGVSLNDPLDAVALSGANMHAASSGDCAVAGTCDAVMLGSPIQVRYGRLAVLPGTASELDNLDVPLLAQYFDGTGFRHHQADQCSQYQLGAATLSDYQDALAAGETTLLAPVVSTALILGGPDPAAPLLLSAPGAGNTGSVLLQLSVPGWLRFDWLGTGDVDPQGRQSFGLFRGHDRVVFWSERLD